MVPEAEKKEKRSKGRIDRVSNVAYNPPLQAIQTRFDVYPEYSPTYNHPSLSILNRSEGPA
jgi:hypothetical protein